MKNLGKILLLWFCLGMIYYTIEGIWRLDDHGYASVYMLPVGGLCGIAVGSLNQFPKFFKLPVFIQSLIGALITLIVEFISGCVLNLWLGFDIWDYSNMFGNILGQVCPIFGVAWLFLMPFAIWIEDALRYAFWNEGIKYSIISVYREFFTLK